MVKTIFGLIGTALSIWEHENASKYMEEAHDLQRRYDEEHDKDTPDRNVLDHIERDIIRLSDLVTFEIGRSGEKNNNN